ncbi:TldD/PmbA family protein [Alterisphingorhabdus coralli]|uniref:Metallopeptidase TldD-related protein n=1 Tax=Alterisphingorhabdus coralli TaxID=3071408 RepID=A0AA97I1F5_9SPHN|nr:metallopeptidase TldD-related protein [Parasphingorhabdus sp. SCSIO 66989]WOE75240.1 metallopeptidase TldD-related protein [Parasphingorhabdus sp. SCSIO 66989]
MLNEERARKAAEQCVDYALKQGATAADAACVAEESTDVQVRLGALEDVQRSESAELGLRVFVGQQVASVSTTRFDDETLKELAERVVDMAKAAPEDPYARLAPKDRLYTHEQTAAALDICDEAAQWDATSLRSMAEAAEDAARSIDGVTNSEGGSVQAGGGLMALATSDGFSGGYRSTVFAMSASVLAGSGSDMQRDYAYHMARHLDDLEDAASIGRRAGARAVARMNPVTLPSGPRPIVFDPRVGGSLIGHLTGAITGSAVARKASFLAEDRGKQIFPEAISIIEDPHRHRGLRSRLYDGEGVTAQPHRLIDKGVVDNWLLNCSAAAQLEMETTGHASRGSGGSPGISVSNIHLEAGDVTPEALMSDIQEGFYVTELIGMGVNGVTGDYSRGAGGFAIRNGKLAEAVSEVTIAGNLRDMFAAIVAADDLEMRRAINVPTLRIDGMTVAGH